MNEKAKQYDQIEALLAGELSAAERERVEERMRKDANFEQEVALHRELEATFGDPNYDRLQKMLQTNRSANRRRQLGPLKWLGNWGLAAALLLLISAALLFLFNPEPNFSGAEVFTEYFEPYSTGNFRNSGLDNRQQALTPAEVNFKKSQEYLATGNAKAALSLLEVLEQENDLPGLQQPISWYVALAQLQTEDLTAARLSLKRIAEESAHYKSAVAAEILGKMP
ncbi:MAG: hypothetical protein AAF433_07535 [Bacteroidota bacterium]